MNLIEAIDTVCQAGRLKEAKALVSSTLITMLEDRQEARKQLNSYKLVVVKLIRALFGFYLRDAEAVADAYLDNHAINAKGMDYKDKFEQLNSLCQRWCNGEITTHQFTQEHDAIQQS